ncbi:MAG TPA: DUF3300 domain-containing protein [Desulfuromonadaceae bacterium]|jgi:hypothetical protein
MKRIIIFLVLLFLPGLIAAPASRAQEDFDAPGQYLFSPEELDDLLAPIALYPDPLLAQVLPAATFIDQIDEAARFVRLYGRSSRIDSQPWDVSVKAVAHYPQVLYMMDQKYDWTVSVGQAFINQQADVMASVQRLRADARAVGNLDTTPQQQVVVESGYVRIIPAEPTVIYVPTYDPWLVYYESAPASYGFITFGIGFSIGAWLNRDCDWYGQRIYYHGWRGDGWVSRSRRHIRTSNNVYISNNYRNINVNPRVVRHDVTRYREQLRRDVQLNPRGPGRQPAPLRQVTPGRVESRPDRSRPADQTRPGTTTRTPPARSTSGVTSPSTPTTRDIYRGRDIQKSQPASRSGYGGYGTGRDATIYREHGRSSRENMRQKTTPASPPSRSVPAPPPVPRSVPVLPSTPALPSIPARPVQPSAPAQRSAPVQRSMPSQPSGAGIGQPAAPGPAQPPATGGRPLR